MKPRTLTMQIAWLRSKGLYWADQPLRGPRSPGARQARSEPGMMRVLNKGGWYVQPCNCDTQSYTQAHGSKLGRIVNPEYVSRLCIGPHYHDTVN